MIIPLLCYKYSSICLLSVDERVVLLVLLGYHPVGLYDFKKSEYQERFEGYYGIFGNYESQRKKVE